MEKRWDAYLAVALDGDDVEIQVDGHAGDIAQIAAMALADVIVQSSPEKEQAIKMLDDMKNRLDGITADESDEEGDPLGKVHTGLRVKAGMAAGALCIIRGRKACESRQSAGKQTPYTGAGHDGIRGAPHIYHRPQRRVPPHQAAADPRRA